MISKIIDYLSIITMEDEMWTPIIIDGEYTNYFIGLGQNRKIKRVLIHTLVARAFVNNDDPENKKIVQHIDFNRLNPIPVPPIFCPLTNSLL